MKNKFTYSIAEFITSMLFLIILMIPFMWYRFYEFETLFAKWLPIPDPTSRQLAARLISLVFITMTLLFMVNGHRLFKLIKLVLASTALIINLFFWSLSEEKNWFFIIFISCVIAAMELGQAFLFDNQWKEMQEDKMILQKIDSSKTQLETLKTKIESETISLKNLQEEKEKLTQVIEEHLELKKKIHCETCDKTFGSPQAKNAHKCEPNERTHTT